MSFVIFCAQCGKECGFIKNDNPKKEEIYGVCKACSEAEDDGNPHNRVYGDKAKPDKAKNAKTRRV